MSETVQRYDIEECSGNPYESYRDMVRAPDGDWVYYVDYAALAQRLADVAYLEAWAQGHPDREYGRWGVGVQAYDEDGQRHTAASLPALGARLRAIAENH